MGVRERERERERGQPPTAKQNRLTRAPKEPNGEAIEVKRERKGTNAIYGRTEKFPTSVFLLPPLLQLLVHLENKPEFMWKVETVTQMRREGRRVVGGENGEKERRNNGKERLIKRGFHFSPRRDQLALNLRLKMIRSLV